MIERISQPTLNPSTCCHALHSSLYAPPACMASSSPKEGSNRAARYYKREFNNPARYSCDLSSLSNSPVNRVSKGSNAAPTCRAVQFIYALPSIRAHALECACFRQMSPRSAPQGSRSWPPWRTSRSSWASRYEGLVESRTSPAHPL